MASQLRSLKSIAVAFSTALGKKVVVYHCPCGDAVLSDNTSCEGSN